MAITRISQSSVKEGLEKYNSFYAGLLGAFIGNFESIATVTVGSGGAAAIEFTSIPSTYQHLQIRALIYGSTTTDQQLQFNGNTATYTHQLYGNGASALAGAYSSTGYIDAGATGTTYPAAYIIDLLDYASTSKTKVGRVQWGYDYNGSGRVGINSILWNSTSALTSLALTGRNMAQHSTAALYGLRAP